ncbi:MAG: hypothetical protein AABZ30_01265 [Myxococcota bacterium]
MSRALASLVATAASAQIEIIADDEGGPGRGSSSAAEGFAPEAQAGGFFSTELAQDTVQETDVREDAMTLRAQAFARADYRVSRLRLHLDGWLDWWLTGERGDDALVIANGERWKAEHEATLGEAFVDADLARVALTAGHLIVVWGQNDLVNPNDVVNPRDRRHGVSLEPETARLPVVALRARAPVGPLSAEALWVPFFRADRVDLFGGDWALFGPGAPAALRGFADALDDSIDDSIEDKAQPVLLQTEMPDETAANGSVGARLSSSAGGYDVAAQVFYGWARLPTIEIDADAFAALAAGDFDAARAGYRAYYRRSLSAGASFGTNLGDFGVRADGAFTPRREYPLGGAFPLRSIDDEHFRPSIDSGAVDTTLGVEYAGVEDVVLHAEAFHQRMLKDPEGQELLFGGPSLYGAALLLRWALMDGDLELRALAVLEATRRSLVASPQVVYRVSDTWSLRAGAHVFEGREGSLGAFYDRNDEIYLGAKASF